MAPLRTMRNILMELRKVCQHPYLSAPELENEDAPDEEQHKQLVTASGKLAFLKLLLPKLKERGHRVLLFSQFKIALNRIEDFLYGEGYKFLRLDGDVQQAERQKAMDAFNAPGSEYFIFLLTTRAGGVGINLATADTVIIHDPDFNPHMDLQAIARSHRYGQKNRVLVFKLMTKDSVEERIIQKGKRKMVLDHLVVQQLGKENEEGEIDNILLHGAASLYASDQNGISASDIRYTADDVEELIDKVEKDAETEALAMEEREKTHENGGDEAAKPKETMSFGFAKVWESDQKRIQEAEQEEEEDRPEDMLNAWQLVMDNAVRERARRLAEETEAARVRRVRKAAAVSYKVDAGAISDEVSPTKKKSGNLPKKKKKKSGSKSSDAGEASFAANPKASDTDDADFAVDPDEPESDEESIASFGGGMAELLDDDMRWGGSMAGENIGKDGVDPGKAIRAIVASASGAASLGPTQVNGSAEVFTVLLPAKSKSKRNETPQERAARKTAKRQDSSKAITSAQDTSSRVSPGTIAAQQAILRATVTPDRQFPVDPHLWLPGQNILAWMFSIFRDRGMTAYQNEWGMLALPEVEMNVRQELYNRLANFADDALRKEGQAPYFTAQEQHVTVKRLLELKGPGMPETHFIPSRPENVTRNSKTAVVQVYDQHLPTPYSSPKQQPRLITAPAVDDSSSIPAEAHIAAYLPSAPKPPAPNSVVAGSGGDGQEPCIICKKSGHRDVECTEIPTVDDLISFRQIILDSQENPADKASGLEEIRKFLHIHFKAGRLDAATWSLYDTSPEVAIRYRDPTLGTKHAAILVDDDDEMPEPPKKKKRIDLSSSSTFTVENGRRPPDDAGDSSMFQLKKSRGKYFTGCNICGREPSHPAKMCPVMNSGPEAIREAMRKFGNNDPMWAVMEQLLGESLEKQGNRPNNQPLPELQASKASNLKQGHCPFCGVSCGLSIRECAELHGGRKKLKDKIRKIESERTPGVDMELDRDVDKLFKAYQEWPKPAKAA
ncbi:hypothetical protein BCR39DRAFT_542680 [Naematelia encephala]|uniref:Helicase C-terminal domain-containing protein n=1 Tax=Naematelia encephala TaxID=71784 RepID=A0A1Y2AVJ9_9TREE|nr:hypothetical protein BCR39DRAFT_542680 [Naematelia encephala]